MVEMSLFEISMLVAQLAMVGTVLYQYPNLSKKLGYSFGTFIKSVLHGLAVGCFAFFTMIFISYLYISVHDTFQDFRNKTQKPETVSETSEVSQPAAETVSVNVPQSPETLVPSPTVQVSETQTPVYPFSEADIPLTAVLPQFKEFIVQEVNHIYQANDSCREYIDLAKTSYVMDESTEDRSVFLVPCGAEPNRKTIRFVRQDKKSRFTEAEEPRIRTCRAYVATKLGIPLSKVVGYETAAVREIEGNRKEITLPFKLNQPRLNGSYPESTVVCRFGGKKLDGAQILSWDE